MRRERITYTGAYSHIMNHGYDGNDIFFGNKNKSQFFDYPEWACNQMMIRLFAYCVIDNHYHLVLENSSGKIGAIEFQKNIPTFQHTVPFFAEKK
jgi:putative transposase